VKDQRDALLKGIAEKIEAPPGIERPDAPFVIEPPVPPQEEGGEGGGGGGGGEGDPEGGNVYLAHSEFLAGTIPNTFANPSKGEDVCALKERDHGRLLSRVNLRVAGPHPSLSYNLT
jgi:hypothetical protein